MRALPRRKRKRQRVGPLEVLRTSFYGGHRNSWTVQAKAHSISKPKSLLALQPREVSRTPSSRRRATVAFLRRRVVLGPADNHLTRLFQMEKLFIILEKSSIT